MLLTVYRCLLCLYPGSHRDEFSEEMKSVFCDAQSALPRALGTKTIFYRRELCGLVSGALCAHLDRIFGFTIPFRRCYMQSQFRFPRSTVFLMWVILAGVLLAIAEAKNIALPYGPTETRSAWSMLPWFIVVAVILVCSAGAAAWGILLALKRTGMHRLERLDTALKS